MANRPQVLSNQGIFDALEMGETRGKMFEVIVGQHIWFATGLPSGATLYLELEHVDKTLGRVWIPMHSLAAADLITRSGVIAGSTSVDLLSGNYRVTASAVGARSFIGRLGTPYP